MYSVSVIVPVYKGRQFISRLVNMFYNSFLLVERELNNFEIIFINDYIEETITEEVRIAEASISMQKKFEVKVIDDKKHRGIHGARVEGLRQSKSDLIMFFDQDDEINNTYFKTQLENIEENDIVVCNGYWHNAQPIYDKTFSKKNIFAREYALKYLPRMISPGQALVRREKIPQYWCNNILKYNGNDDNYLWLLMIWEGCKIGYNENLVYTHSENGQNASHNWSEMAASKEETFEKICDSGIFSSAEIQRLQKTINNYVCKYKIYEAYDELFELLKSKTIGIEDKTIYAIYGMGVYGKKLWDFMEHSGFKIKYGIDQDSGTRKGKYIVKTMKDGLEDVDTIIVTPMFAYDQICKELHKVTKSTVIGMDQWLKTLYLSH